jgi:hypothetical protein
MKDGKPDESKQEDLEADKRPARHRREGALRRALRRLARLEVVKDHIKTDYVPSAPTARWSPRRSPTRRASAASTPSATSSARPGSPTSRARRRSSASSASPSPTARRSTSPSRWTTPSSRAAPTASPRSPASASPSRRSSAKGLKKGEDYEVGQFPFTALGKAIAAAHTEGFVKIIRGLPRGEILGAHIMGDQATELIAEFSLARRMEATTEELIATSTPTRRCTRACTRRRWRARDA